MPAHSLSIRRLLQCAATTEWRSGEREDHGIPLLYRRIEGRRGKVEIPFLGTLCGEINHWTVVRRAETGPESELYNFHATLQWVNAALFNDPDYATKRKISVTIARGGRVYVVVPVEGEGQRTVLTGKSLIVDRVRLE